MSSKIFFTSDTHFSHSNIIKYCSRPFRDAAHMNEELIKRWNDTVGIQDVVYHLGDFGFGQPNDLLKIRNRLNGNIFFIRGNHDKKFLHGTFGWEKDYHEVEIDNTKIVLCHYPMLTWNKEHRGAIMLSGHTHNPEWLVRKGFRGIHVGVDAFDFTPVSWSKVKSLAASINVTSDFRNRNEQEKPNA